MNYRLSPSPILALIFGSLIMVVILLVLGFGIVSATRNTVDLLRDRADIGIGIITSEIEDHLKSARDGTYIDGTYGDDGGVLDNSRVFFTSGADGTERLPDIGGPAASDVGMNPATF